MKKFKIIVTFLMGIAIFSCSTEDKTVDEIVAGTTSGAVLRTTKQISPALNILNESSLWSIEIEEQDKQGGALLKTVSVYVDLIGNTSSGAPTTEALLDEVAASEFEIGPFGLPRTTLSYSLAEMTSAMGLVNADYDCGDNVLVRLELELTDGRTFTSNQASGTISQSFFNSPFQYSVPVVTLLSDPDLYSGTYMLTQTIPGLYGVEDYVDGTYTVVSVSNTIKKVKSVPTLAAFGGFGPVDFNFQLVCGEIQMSAGQSLGAGCVAAIASGPADVHTTYDVNNPDDTDFFINFTSDSTGDCVSGVQAQIRMQKVL